ncbi:hypothetical protein Tco_0416947 [Tanacetum coccineum]
MIGSLMYLTASRSDIMFAVCVCARHQVTPKECHLHAVKRIFRYLKGQPKLGLWYPRDSPFDLVAYSDSDYDGDNQDRKSTTGGCQFLGRRLISWQCKKQIIVATSTTEAEYVVAASGCGQVLWIQNQLLDYGYALEVRPTIYASHIKQFWSTARTETINGEAHILATIDGRQRTITELSIRSSNIATAIVCFATQRTYNFSKMILDGMISNIKRKTGKFLMYPRFIAICLNMGEFGAITHKTVYPIPSHTSKVFTTLRVNSPSFSGRNIGLFDHMLIQQGDRTEQPPVPHHTPSPPPQIETTDVTHTSLPPAQITPQITPSITLPSSTPAPTTTLTPTRLTRSAIRIAQSKTLSPGADEPASLLRGVRHGEAFTTVSSLDAGQGRETIAKSSTIPHDSPPRVTSFGVDEGSMQPTLTELMAFCTNL